MRSPGTWRLFMGVLVVLRMTAMSAAAQDGSHATQPPNIVLILADDYGIDGIGAYGSDRFNEKTPNLDALAQSGMRFDRAFATPICGPSRVQLITGRYPLRTGGLSHETVPR